MCRWALSLAFSLAAFNLSAAEVDMMFNPTSFLAGMLLIAWLLCMQLRQNTITRILNLNVGLATLAFLSFQEPLVFLLVIFAILVQLFFELKDNQRYSRTAVASYSALVCAAIVFVVLQITTVSPNFLALASIVYLLIQNLLAELNGSPEPVNQMQLPGATTEITNAKQGYPDRAMFKAQFNQWQQDATETGHLVVFKFDGFSEINQKLGHDFGDLLLVQLTSRINSVLQGQALLEIGRDALKPFYFCHLNSVEYAFLITQSEQKHLYEQLIGQLIQISNQPISIKGCLMQTALRAAMVEVSPQQALSFEEQLKCAYLALDVGLKKNEVVSKYTPAMSELRNEQLAKIGLLDQVDYEKDFELYFHPVVNLKTNEIIFIELLLRWNHPTKGLLDASAFVNEIKIAGMSYSVTKWVLEKAAEIALMLKVADFKVPVSINLFGSELFNDEMIEHLTHLIAEHQLNPKYLIIECPANVLLNLEDKGAAILKRLKAMDVPVCLDDLGVSPLLLTQLPKLTLQYVKLDDGLITELSQNSNTRNLLRGIINMCSNLESKVIAEGVASSALLEFVEGLQCDAAQGYLFTRPLSIVGVTAWLAQWQQKLDHQQRPY